MGDDLKERLDLAASPVGLRDTNEDLIAEAANRIEADEKRIAALEAEVERVQANYDKMRSTGKDLRRQRQIVEAENSRLVSMLGQIAAKCRDADTAEFAATALSEKEPGDADKG